MFRSLRTRARSHEFSSNFSEATSRRSYSVYGVGYIRCMTATSHPSADQTMVVCLLRDIPAHSRTGRQVALDSPRHKALAILMEILTIHVSRALGLITHEYCDLLSSSDEISRKPKREYVSDAQESATRVVNLKSTKAFQLVPRQRQRRAKSHSGRSDGQGTFGNCKWAKSRNTYNTFGTARKLSETRCLWESE